MTLSSYLIFVLTLFTAAILPGPGIAALVGRALKSGFWATLPLLAGITIGDLIWFTFASLGLAVLASTLGTLFVVVKYIGVAYLLYLAFKFWTAPVEVETVEAASRGSILKTLGLGVTVTLSNPKAITFYLALMPLALDLKSMGVSDFLIIAATIVFVLFLVLGAYTLFASTARQVFAAPGARRRLNKVAAAVMGGAATLIAVR